MTGVLLIIKKGKISLSLGRVDDGLFATAAAAAPVCLFVFLFEEINFAPLLWPSSQLLRDIFHARAL